MRLTCRWIIVVAAVAGPAALAAAPEQEGTGTAAAASAFVSPGVPHPGSDQIFWVPTFAQAEEVARHTGRMILVMGSVGDWSGY